MKVPHLPAQQPQHNGVPDINQHPNCWNQNKNDEIDTPLDKFKEVREIPQLFFAHLSPALIRNTNRRKLQPKTASRPLSHTLAQL